MTRLNPAILFGDAYRDVPEHLGDNTRYAVADATVAITGLIRHLDDHDVTDPQQADDALVVARFMSDLAARLNEAVRDHLVADEEARTDRQEVAA